MSRRTKSVDEPPICRPTLAPPTEYIAGADHLPLKFAPPRQSRGPRPPLPPTPKPNFFTLGRMSTQFALGNIPGEMLLLSIRPCNTRLACRMVSSSFCLSPANIGRVSKSIAVHVRKQDKLFRVICPLIFSDAFRRMVFSFSLLKGSLPLRRIMALSMRMSKDWRIGNCQNIQGDSGGALFAVMSGQ